MKGLKLDLLKADLNKVSPRYREPICAIRNIDRKFGGKLGLIEEYYGGFSFFHDCYKLDLRFFRLFSFDELCKIKYSTCFMMDESVNKFFETHYQYEVVRKIWSSMHQWSSSSRAWNEIVDAYECIRHFSFSNNPDFEVRLDFTRYHNYKGRSKYSETHIDGVFSFLVYYKKQHVMTIGYSILNGKRILIQQVQLVKKRKNRFLYKYPINRIEFVLELFSSNFFGYQLYLVDGLNLAENLLSEYRSSLSRWENSLENHRAHAKEFRGADRRRYRAWAKEDLEAIVIIKGMIEHLEKDSLRLKNYYCDTGRYKLDKETCIRRHNLSHYAVLM